MADDAELNKKLPLKAHLICGWPIFLIFIGGAIGGVLGVAAYYFNITLYKSDLPLKAKITQSLLAGLGAFVALFVFAMVMTGLQSGV